MLHLASELHLTIESGSDPITGSFASPGGAETPFSGWIELAAAIENARIGLPVQMPSVNGTGTRRVP